MYQDRNFKNFGVGIHLSMFDYLKCSYIHNFELMVNKNIFLIQHKIVTENWEHMELWFVGWVFWFVVWWCGVFFFPFYFLKTNKQTKTTTT